MKPHTTLFLLLGATSTISVASVLPASEKPTLLLNDTRRYQKTSKHETFPPEDRTDPVTDAIRSRDLQTRAPGWVFQSSFYGFEARILGLSMVSRKAENLELFVSTDIRHGTAHMYWEEGAKSWMAEYWHKVLDGPSGYDYPTGKIVGLSRQYNNMEAFFVAHDKFIRSRYWVSGNGWKKSGEDKSSLAHNGAAIAVTSKRADSMELFWVSRSGGNVYHSYWFDDGKGWVKDQLLFGPYNGWAKPDSISAVSRDTNLQDVFWVTTSGNIQVASYHNGWSRREIIGPKAHVNSRTAANSPTTGQYNVFYVGTDSRVYALRWNSQSHGGWKNEKVSDIAADSGTVLSVTSREPHLLEVFWLATDGTIKHAWWESAGGWRSEGLPGSNAGTACLPRGDITVVSRDGRNTIEGFCISKASPNRVHHFYYYG